MCQVCQARGFEFFTMVLIFGSEKFHSGFEFFATYILLLQTAVDEFYNRIDWVFVFWVFVFIDWVFSHSNFSSLFAKTTVFYRY